MSRGSAVVPFFMVLVLAGTACVSSTDLATLEADVNDARRIAFENRGDLRELKQQIGEVGTGETQTDLSDIAEAFRNIRTSQADLYRRLDDLERSFQQTTGQAEEVNFQNAQNMRVLMERVDALSTQMRTLHARIAGTGPMPAVSDPGAGGALPGPAPTVPGAMPPGGQAGIAPGSGAVEGGVLPSPDPGPVRIAETPPGDSTPDGPQQPLKEGAAGTAVPAPVTLEPGAVAESSEGLPAQVAALGVTPVALYRRGHELLQEKKFSEARKVFNRFLKDYPEHTYAGNAQYWMAETYYAEQNFEDAILAYEDVIRKFKGSDKVPGAMLKQGYSFISLHDARTAKVLLESVVRKYPDSEEAALARKKLTEIEKASGTP